MKNSKQRQTSTQVDDFFAPADELEQDVVEFIETIEVRQFKLTPKNEFDELKRVLSRVAKTYQEQEGKTKPVTIRLNTNDLLEIKTKARNYNMPYQTLIKSLVTQYAHGKISLSL